MHKILVDTNILIDIIKNREYELEDSIKIFELGEKRNIHICINIISLSNLFYICSKTTPIKDIKNYLKYLTINFQIIYNSNKIIIDSCGNKINDFEDSIQYYSAIENNCNIIVTRDNKGFIKNGIEVMSPKEFITKY